MLADATGAAIVALRDGTYPDRLGYTALVARPGKGTAVRSTVSSEDPTRELRRYPPSVVQRLLDQRTAVLTVRKGDAMLVAPRLTGGDAATTRSGAADGFASVLEDTASGKATLLLLVLAALGWGALHALSPGHGKTMVAAVLVGSKGPAPGRARAGTDPRVQHRPRHDAHDPRTACRSRPPRKDQAPCPATPGPRRAAEQLFPGSPPRSGRCTLAPVSCEIS